MSVGEQHASTREPVNTRRPGVRVAAEAAHPIVHIVNSNEQDIGALGVGRENGADIHAQDQQ